MRKTLKSFLLLLHYWFPIVLGWSVALVLQRAIGASIRPSGIDLYLLGICSAYSLDRLLDGEGSQRASWLNTTLWAGFLISTVLGMMLALQISLQTLSAMLVFSGITLVYTRLKQVPFLKVILVAVVWTWAGVALPFQNHHWFAWQFWTIPASLPLVLLIASGCVLCDFKDLKSDALDGVRSLPVMFGLRKAMWITSILLLITAFISFQDNRPGLAVSSGALILLTQFPDLLAREAVGPLVVDAALTIPGVLIALHLI